MKKIFFCALICVSGNLLYAQSEKKFNDTSYLQPVEVQAVRATDKAPFAKTDLTKKDIEKNNLGQDLPFLLNQTPGTVVNADAGNGIGYTGIHIRGIDATRINVTLNSIPYNDAESQGTFFVDLPDISSSANSIQVQRGVGTSSNGTGSFGGAINLSTNEVNNIPYVALNNSYGSFNTWKNNLQFGSGIMDNHFTIDGRLSGISSDGYIDRAKTNLRSAFFSTAYVSAKNSLRLNIFSGKEKTYQAWDGVPEYLLDSMRTYNQNGTEKPGTPYENETDNYIQTHYQLFYNHKFNEDWKANIAVFFTKGRGYYEEYRKDQALADYGLPDYNDGTTVYTNTDLVRRLWLDNNFYGTIFSLQYHKKQTQFIFGGGWNGYDGKHYGEIIWAKVQPAVPAGYHWYNLTAHKKDLSFYGKWTQQWMAHWQSFIDLQYRNVPYTINGFRDNPTLIITKNYSFFNPKMGLTYTHKGWQAYASYAIAAKEPIRDDFEAGTTQQPKAEVLYDAEMGVEKKYTNASFGIGFYYMKYHDQLILTGKINDVGAYTRTNVPNSYRAGIELQGKYVFCKHVNLVANASFSENKIKDFTEYLDEYDVNYNYLGQKTKFYPLTDISFSPKIIAGGSINILPVKNAEISLVSKYVDRQYLDNTSKRSRSLGAYYIQDVRLSYLLEGKTLKTTSIIVQFNNIFSRRYEPNGYSYSDIYNGGTETFNNYFPMAPFNFMVGLNVRL